MHRHAWMLWLLCHVTNIYCLLWATPSTRQWKERNRWYLTSSSSQTSGGDAVQQFVLCSHHGRPSLNSQGLHCLRTEKLKEGGYRLVQRWTSSPNKAISPSQVSRPIRASGSLPPKETTHVGRGRALLAQVGVQLPDILRNRKYLSLWRAVINHFSHLRRDQNRSKENHNCTSF